MKNTKIPSQPLVCTGEVSIAAAAQNADDPAANKRMTIAAYNGGTMRVNFWSAPVGIQLSGLSWRSDAAIPILCLHDTHDLDAICGQSTKISHDGRSLTIEADFMPVSDDAKKIYELAKAGFKFQASVGVSPSKVVFIDKDQSFNLNGVEIKGECYVVTEGTLNEVSIVPLGADGSTRTAIAAAITTTQRKEGIMPEEENKNIEAAQNAERDRIASVIAVCGDHKEIMAQAVKEGWDADKAELACLKAEKAAAQEIKAQKKVIASRPAAPAIINPKDSAPRDAKTVVAAACLAAAMPERTVESVCKGTDLDAAHDLGIARLSDIFAAFGFDYRPGNDASMSKAIQAAFSTADIPNVLSNVAHKFVLAGFGAVANDWKLVSRPVPVSDFKAVKGVRLVMGGLLKPLAKGGELQHVNLSDEARSVQAATKGSIIGITREDLVNDDLSVLSAIPLRFGQMAARTINKDVFAALVAVAAADFGANTTGALHLANLAAAYGLALAIKDSNGDPIGAIPNKILCSPSNFLTAKSIYQSELITGAAAEKPQANSMRNLLEPITSPFLSGTKYWLFNDAFPPVDVAFLNGVQTPTVETASADFSQLGIQMRCYFDYGASAGETKAALYSTGA